MAQREPLNHSKALVLKAFLPQRTIYRSKKAIEDKKKSKQNLG